MQLMTAVTPELDAIKKGRRVRSSKDKPVDALPHCGSCPRSGYGYDGWLGESGLNLRCESVGFYVIAITSLVTGAVFMMWLGEQITERASVTVFHCLSLQALWPDCHKRSVSRLSKRARVSLIFYCCSVVLALAIVVIALVVFIERGQRRVTVNYAKRQQGVRCIRHLHRTCRSK